jgi:hypothetical protein
MKILKIIKTIESVQIEYCCRDMKEAISNSFLKEMIKNNKVIEIYYQNSLGYFQLTYCPFCGKEIEEIEN